ncbi:MAG: DUF6682 family protein [Tagaea sp.]
MARTVQQILDAARTPLNDASKERFPDPELLGYYQDAIGLIRKSRPDLFIGRLLEEPSSDLGVESPVPFTHYQTVQDYITARAQMKDDAESGAKQNALLELAIAGIR